MMFISSGAIISISGQTKQNIDDNCTQIVTPIYIDSFIILFIGQYVL